MVTSAMRPREARDIKQRWLTGFAGHDPVEVYRFYLKFIVKSPGKIPRGKVAQLSS
jgi:hypothetical protein